MRHENSLDADYFEGIFAADEDPWGLDSESYEAAKFDDSIAAITDRRYERGFEIGCAQGALTRRLAPLCGALLAIDVSTTALDRARKRCADQPNVTFEQMAYPREQPSAARFDLMILSEVAYYWDAGDLGRAADQIAGALAPGGRILLVHWTGETDYPQTGDGAVEALWDRLHPILRVERADRREKYRLDLWRRS
ncbi:SAM-dependent methyltransferase [Sphingomonas sp. BIUV-7]|uniref:SAM-dependent methyltransferase n=1 Tax=Sphingomonas natans TaxID=3063330 RepID=A0ABT8Y9U1_9SPHN|nr:SAM-dependent methyltransferase [Sphingomonas sp. BIUV-7]MDO6415099.1 SAM-dependent methyltransferase [Sphingomonas sp. BIUV-7]